MFEKQVIFGQSQSFFGQLKNVKFIYNIFIVSLRFHQTKVCINQQQKLVKQNSTGKPCW